MKPTRLILTSLSLLLSQLLQAQVVDDWGDWEQIYSDNNLTVEVQFYYAGSSCNGGKAFKYKSKISGVMKQTPTYLNWKFDYLNCDGVMYTQYNSVEIGSYGAGGDYVELSYESIDFKFTGQKFIRHYDYQVSSQKKEGSERTIFERSLTPIEIKGEDTLTYGGKGSLAVNGALGRNSQWVWYADGCAQTFIGKGWTIPVPAEITRTYFVRAEGYNDTSACLSKTVYVDTNSRAPSAITGTTKLCKGQSTVLTVNGGSLGIDAEWVWYEKSCEKGIEIGRGNSIKVSPKATAMYYVRAEGRQNITRCAQAQVIVSSGTPSMQADSIIVIGKRTICEGESIELQVKGGSLTEDAIWNWHENTCDGPVAGSGERIKVSPNTNTTYFLKADGACYSTNCVQTKIIVMQTSLGGGRIVPPGTVYKGKKTELKITGGKLGNGSQWYWYTEQCGTGKLIGTGETISVKVKEQTSYYVRPSGSCNQVTCATVTINPIKTHGFDPRYPRKSNKFWHYGIGFGFEYQQFSPMATTTHFNTSGPTTTDTTRIKIGSIGYKFEGAVHPLIKEYFSWGLMASYAGGKNTEDNTNIKEKYNYNTLILGSEMALGFRPFKLLVKITENFQTNSLTRSDMNSIGTPTTTYSYNNRYYTEQLSLGLRLGRYAAKHKKRSGVFDIYYNLMRNRDEIKNYDNLLDTWDVGFGVAFWKQSLYKIKCDLILDKNIGEVKTRGIGLSHDKFRLTFMINIDQFY
jgi:hypothetical protein